MKLGRRGEERNRVNEFTSLRRLLAGLCLVPRCSLVRPFSAIGGPFELLVAVKRAWLQIPSWDLQSIYGQAIRRVFRNYNSTWQRYRNIEGSSFCEKQLIWP